MSSAFISILFSGCKGWTWPLNVLHLLGLGVVIPVFFVDFATPLFTIRAGVERLMQNDANLVYSALRSSLIILRRLILYFWLKRSMVIFQ